MAQIVSLLSGKNRNFDHQLTALHKTLINQWVISGLAVTSGQVQSWEAFIECTRSNGEKIMVLFQNTSVLNIDTSWTAKIYIEINQENIDNGIINAEDGSNIGSIKRGSAYPSNNYIPLASIAGGSIADERKFIGRKIPDIRWINRKPSEYNSQTAYWPELVEWSTIGISGVNWVNLFTYCSWNNTEPEYTTQLAITAMWTPWMWIRKARNADNWNSWQQVYPLSVSESSELQEAIAKIGKYTRTCPMAVAINGTADNPVPVSYWWRMYVQLRANHSNSGFMFSTNANSTNRQIVITNDKYAIQLKKILYKWGWNITAYIQEWSTTANKISLWTGNGSVITCDYTIEPNKTYIITGFPVDSGMYKNYKIPSPKWFSIEDWVNNVYALEFDLWGKFYPCEANSMYTTLASCDGFVTRNVQQGETLELGYYDNFFYKNTFNSLQDNQSAFIGNVQWTISTTAGTIPSMIGMKKQGWFLTQKINTNTYCVNLDWSTDYNYWEFSWTQRNYCGFFPGWNANINMLATGSGSNVTLHFYWVDGSYQSWNIVDLNSSSEPSPINEKVSLPAWYFNIEVNSMSNSSRISVNVIY